MENHFDLDPRLEADSILVTTLSLSQVRLINNSHFVWLILVPQIKEASELYHLPFPQQQTLLQEVNRLSKALKRIKPKCKLNIASLGNIVNQLHVHVIARTQDDAAWPNPVWGCDSLAYEDKELQALLSRIKLLLEAD